MLLFSPSVCHVVGDKPTHYFARCVLKKTGQAKSIIITWRSLHSKEGGHRLLLVPHNVIGSAISVQTASYQHHPHNHNYDEMLAGGSSRCALSHLPSTHRRFLHTSVHHFLRHSESKLAGNVPQRSPLGNTGQHRPSGNDKKNDNQQEQPMSDLERFGQNTVGRLRSTIMPMAPAIGSLLFFVQVLLVAVLYLAHKDDESIPLVVSVNKWKKGWLGEEKKVAKNKELE